MKCFKVHVASAAMVALMMVAAPVWAQSCNENCLEAILHRYLAQLPKHDAGPLPVSAQINARENTEPVELGDGSWKTVSAVLPGFEFADPVAGEIVYAGGVRRQNAIGPLFLRLRIAHRQIIESEMLTTGPGAVTPQGVTDDLTPSPDAAALLTPDILYDAIVPQERRSSRKQLLKVPVVNGRVVAVDVPHGIAVGIFFVVRPMQKSAHMAAEIFKVVDGKIRSIEEFDAFGGLPADSGFPASSPASIELGV